MPILTIGHSTHQPIAFVPICKSVGIDIIIDVRSHPTSKWEWWHRGPAEEWLNRSGIGYRWQPALGGWDVRHAPLAGWARPRGVDLAPYIKGHFPKQRIGADRMSGASVSDQTRWESRWTNQGLHDYAWFTAIHEFQVGLEALIAEFGGTDQPKAAIMCAEALWWKCHRSMIADALFARNVPAFNVMASGGSGRIDRHDAAPRLDRYPVEVREVWAEYALAGS